jgi:non-ribosomal peptide synthase protein (TIGR01720 family)
MECIKLISHFAKERCGNGPSPVDKPDTAVSADFAFEIKEFQAAQWETLATYRTTVNELFLLLFLQSWRAVTGENKILLEIEKHGRTYPGSEMPDIGRTLGWFTVFDLYLVEFCKVDLPERMAGLKDQIRNPLFDAFRYSFLKDVSRQIPRWDNVIRFNYLGMFNSADNQYFKISNWNTGEDIHPENRPTCPMEFNCWTAGNVFFIRLRYDALSYSEIQMNHLVRDFKERLGNPPQVGTSLVEYLSPSDFVEAELSKEDFDQLLK